MPAETTELRVQDVKSRTGTAPGGARRCCFCTAPAACRNGCRSSTRWPSAMSCWCRSIPASAAPTIRRGSARCRTWRCSISISSRRRGSTAIHLIGNSLGGWLAAEILIRDRSRFQSLVQLAPAGIRVKGVPCGDNFIWGPEEAVRNLYHDQAFADRILALTPSEEQMDVMLRNRFTVAKLGWQPRWFNPDLEKWLHRIKLPALIVWGDDDKIMPPAICRAVARAPAGCAARRWWTSAGTCRMSSTPLRRAPCPRVPGRSGAMKLVSFHLMPYRPLDLEEAAKHRSPWVVLPNHLYDPVKGAEEYARHIDALVYAEELGFDAIGVNEHHQTAYGLMPAPNLIASALIQRTKTGADRDPRPRPAAGEQPDLHRRRIRDARQSVEGPDHRRLRARHRLGIPLLGHQPVFLARALPRGARPDHPGLDRARSLRLRRRPFQPALRQSVAAALPEPASARLDPVAGVERDGRLGGRSRSANIRSW